MKTHALLDASGAGALEFAWLIDATAPVSEYGAHIFAELQPYRPGKESSAHARAQRIASAAAHLDASKLDALRDVMRNMPDAKARLRWHRWAKA